jgi:hypothetical protein
MLEVFRVISFALDSELAPNMRRPDVPEWDETWFVQIVQQTGRTHHLTVEEVREVMRTPLAQILGFGGNE